MSHRSAGNALAGLWLVSIMRRVLDIKLIRGKPDFVRQRLATRGAGDEKLVETILQTDEQRRKALTEVETLKAQRNRVSKEIGALMGQRTPVSAEFEVEVMLTLTNLKLVISILPTLANKPTSLKLP